MCPAHQAPAAKWAPKKRQRNGPVPVRHVHSWKQPVLRALETKGAPTGDKTSTAFWVSAGDKTAIRFHHCRLSSNVNKNICSTDVIGPTISFNSAFTASCRSKCTYSPWNNHGSRVHRLFGLRISWSSETSAIVTST